MAYLPTTPSQLAEAKRKELATSEASSLKHFFLIAKNVL